MKFITGNAGKFKELQDIFPELEQLQLDLLEIQDLDPQKVIKAKVLEAQKVIVGEPFFVEDTSLCFTEMNNLPGTFIKFFVDDLGVSGIWNLAKGFGSKKAQAKTIIGYCDNEQNIHYFEGAIDGELIEPRGVGFGWDSLFKPDQSNQTFAEMNIHEKEQYSMRTKAANKLKEFLIQK